MQNKDDLLEYISLYCTSLYNENERAAMNHYFAQIKFKTYKEKSATAAEIYNRNTSTDPEVLKLLDNGISEFHRKAAERVLKEHKDDLDLNTCPKCGKIARTPRAKQCRYCLHSWR